MVSDLRLVFLTTVACFQLVLAVEPAALTYADLKDGQPRDALLRSYVGSLSLPRYYSDEGVYNISPPRLRFT